MGKLAFVYPGQGSQRVGMGSELLGAAPKLFEDHMARADAVSGLPVRRYTLDGPIESLTATEVAQPALFSLSLAITDVARERGLRPDYVAGHSLGEYTAAVAAGALSAEDGIRIVSERGRLMAEIQSERPGAMAAILGLAPTVVDELCARAAGAGVVAVANLNAPTQIVVSGEEAAVDRLVSLATEAGAARALRLPVGAAFHSELMAPVQERLRETIAKVAWSDPRIPLVANATGQAVTDGDGVHQALLAQITSPVRWVDCVQTLLRAGCTDFLELGPGRVLSGLIRQIAGSEARVFAADSPAKLARFTPAP